MAFPNVSDLVATTIESRNKEVADNVTNGNAVLAYIKKSGNVKSVTGGSTILEELSFAQNGNAGWYSGYDTLPTAAQDVISAAQYSIKQAAATVSISGLEMLQNSGKQAFIDLLDSRMQVAEDTLRNLIVQGIYSDGTGAAGKQITGLKAAVPLANNAGVYGSIDRATWNFWRNKKFKAAVDGTGVVDASNIQGYMNALYAQLVRGTDAPNLIIMDTAYWGHYVASLQALQRFASPETGALGFQSLKFMGADVIFDNTATGMSANTAYFLNTKYLKFRPHADRNFVALDPSARYSTNQDSKTQIMGWAGNLTCSNASLQGVLQD